MRLSHGDAERLYPVHNVENTTGFTFNAEIARTTTFTGPGKFGRLIDGLAAFQPSDEALTELATSMEDVSFDAQMGDDPAGDNPAIPAGFTYLAQFVDHDITFDKTNGFPTITDPALIVQARTPSLELDSLYGMGPESQPELYEDGANPATAKFKIGRTRPGGIDTTLPGDKPFDLPRNGKTAIIGDPRNDENLAVAQTHLLFLRFHNKLMDTLPDDGLGRTKFVQVQEEVRRHYQFVALHDMVKRFTGETVLNKVLTEGRKHYLFENTPEKRPYMPLEFSVAAYRLGHSMIRQVYDYNRVFLRAPGHFSATIDLLFRFTGGTSPSQGDVPVPSDWIIDWRRFFNVGPSGPIKPNMSRLLDTKMANPLKNLPAFAAIPDEVASLARRNLLRGSRLGLPSGQTLAAAMGVPVLSPEQVAAGADGALLKKHGFDKQSPLWYYILREALKVEDGLRLGPLGALILAEVFVGLLQGDSTSFLNAPGWTAKIPTKNPQLAMVDIIEFVGDINPIGESATAVVNIPEPVVPVP